MKLRDNTYELLGKVFCGDSGHSIRLFGSDVINFFKELGYDGELNEDLPTRHLYAKQKIQEMFEAGELDKFLNAFLNEQRFTHTSIDVNEIIAFLNDYLKMDNCEIKKLAKNSYSLNQIIKEEEPVNKVSKETILAQVLESKIAKCEKKITERDYDGAILSAKEMVEDVLLEIELQLTGKKQPFNGDIELLYNRVKVLVALNNGKEGILQILSGLNAVIIGIGTLKVKDEFVLSKNHAVLAVDSAKMLTTFIISSIK